MKKWPEWLLLIAEAILFFVGVGGAVLFLFGPELGVKVSDNPMAYTGVGAILTYVLTRGRILNHMSNERQRKSKEKKEEADEL